MTSQKQELCKNLLEALNPVRDVTKNWGIDLAQHLEHYLEQIAVEHEEMPMNFAEAALLIQNSTTIYSKKVDYIWDIMQCVLANIHKKKSDSKSGKQTELDVSEHAEQTTKKGRKGSVLDRSKYGEINTEISDKMLDLESSKQKRKPWKFIPTIYHQFQKKAISRKKRYLYTASDEPYEDRKFKVNQMLLHFKMLHHEFKDEGDLLDSTKCFQNSLLVIDQNASCAMEQMDDHMDDSVSHGGGDEPVENGIGRLEENELPADMETTVAEAAAARVKDNVLTVPSPPPAPPPVNAWDPIPFDQGITDKEISHRRITKLPCDKDLLEPPIENGKRKKGKELIPKPKQKLLSRYLQLKSILRKDINSQLDQEFLQQRDLLLAQLNQNAKKRVKFPEIRHELARDFDEFADFFGFEDYENSNGESDFGFRGFGDDDDAHEDDFDVPEAEPLHVDVPLPDSTGIGLPPDTDIVRSPCNSIRNGDQGFEEMCLERIQQKTSQDIIRGQVDLAKRVAQWHEAIKPMLDASEKRAHFDIHEYGTQILNRFPTNNGAKTTLPLKKIFEDVETQDVSRYFLATLQLANTYNVEISTPKEPLVVDQIELTLLSASRLHEDLENYVAPSQEKANLTSDTLRLSGRMSHEFQKPNLPRPKAISSNNQRKRKLKAQP